MSQTKLNEGDLVLLFNNLPYDFSMDLPLSPAAGITVSATPHSLLATPDSDHQPCFVLPGVKLPGSRISNCCLISRISESVPQNIRRDDILFSYLTVLRLLAPAYISAAGQFNYGGEDDPISHMELKNIRSTWQPNPAYHYSGSLLLYGGKLLDRALECLTTGPHRLKYALTMFSHVTNGFSFSYQMNVLGLYAALEALFSPSRTRNYAETLGARLGAYLSPFDDEKSLCDWITKHYQGERHSLSHGFWQFSPDSSRSQERSSDFGKLHEIVRLSLLGFLSMSASEVALLKLTGNKLHRALDNIKPADGQFLQGQKMWFV